MNTSQSIAAMTIEELQSRCVQLEEQCMQLEQQNAELTAKLNWFMEQFRLSKKRQFGVSTERIRPLEEEQLLLFNEAEVEARPEAVEPDLETITYQRHKTRTRREMNLEDLPVEVVEHRLPEEERVCPACGGPLHEMSTEVRQELKVIPAQVNVVKHVRYVYACRRCEREEITTPVITAPIPAPVLPGSPVSPSLMAYIYDPEIRGRSAHLPLILYDYQTTRAGKHPRRFLAGFQGYLHVDGYAGYNELANVILVGCWAHASASSTKH
ncbi:hypothetical protein MCACP_14970 [Neomoorella carbonis]